jgi:hypothetical protein
LLLRSRLRTHSALSLIELGLSFEDYDLFI